jgi:hypothetical protein
MPSEENSSGFLTIVLKKTLVVTLEDETNTSKRCWLTGGTLYEKVYKTYDAKGKEFLQHTTARQPPFVPPADVCNHRLMVFFEMPVKLATLSTFFGLRA